MNKASLHSDVPAIAVERRSGRDRRTQRFGDIRWLLKTGRRRQVRRQADRRKLLLLDAYPSNMLYAISLILMLSVADAMLTLWLIGKGAMEINPVMAYYLKLGPNIFMIIKYLMTASAVTIIVLLNYTIIRSFRIQIGHLLNGFAGCFIMVVMWELFLVMRSASW